MHHFVKSTSCKREKFRFLILSTIFFSRDLFLGQDQVEEMMKCINYSNVL